MLYLNHPFSAKVAMFREAAAVGASTIRVDVSLSGVFVNPLVPDWSGVNQYMLLARRYHVHVLADLLATPWYIIDCPPGTPTDLTYRCPPSNPTLWGEEAGLIAAHTRGLIDLFEIINEPDGGWAFYGTPEQYAQVLAASYTAIHRANPTAKVLLGGLMDVTTHGWIQRVLEAPGVDAIDKFDIANIHVRTTAQSVADVVHAWRRYLASRGFRGPLWVTETGYPADPAFETDPGYYGGAAAQARWLAAVIPAMLCAGAARVFVTERDGLTGRYATEGFLQSGDPLTANPTFTRRPSFNTIRTLARNLAQSPAVSTRLACGLARNARVPRLSHRRRPS